MIYREARYYEIVYQQGTAEEARDLLKLSQRFDLKRGHVFEAFCGAGRLMFPLAKDVGSVWGMDLEEEMIRRGKERLKKSKTPVSLRFMKGDIRKAHLQIKKKFDWSYNLIGSIRHLLSEQDLQMHLRSMAKILKPKAVYFVGTNIRPEEPERNHADLWKSARGRLRVRLRVHYEPEFQKSKRLEKVTNELSVKSGSAPAEHRSSHYYLRTYRWSEWKRSLESSAFQIKEVFDDTGKPTQTQSGHLIFALELKGRPS